MYLSNFISSRHYNIKSSLSIEIAQKWRILSKFGAAYGESGEDGFVSGGQRKCRRKRGLTLWLRIKASAKKGQRGAPNWLQTIYYGRNNKVN